MIGVSDLRKKEEEQRAIARYHILIVCLFGLGVSDIFAVCLLLLFFFCLFSSGTPPHQNHHHLHLQQYLIPFKCQGKADNFVLGHYLPAPLTTKPVKKNQALIWGKEAKYYTPYKDLLTEIQKIIPLVVMAKPDVTPHLPAGVKNLGIVSQSQRQEVLSQSKFLLGLGDPVLGLTPFESLHAGTPYLNPHFPHPKTFWMNTACSLTSQHPDTETLKKPFVYQVKLNDIEGVKKTVREVLNEYEDNPNGPVRKRGK